MAVRNQISAIELEEFFRSLQELLISSFNDVSFDSAEYISRRLDGYERNLSVLLARLQESFPNEAQLLTDMRDLLGIVRTQKERSEVLSFRSLMAEEQQTNDQISVNQIRSCVGRPRLHVSEELLGTLHSQVGFSWSQIARDLGISESTIRRRRRLFQMPSQQVFSNIENSVLDRLVREILDVTPRIGYRLIQGALRQRGLHVQRRRVLESLHRVDPVVVTLRGSRSIIRRRYSVPCPNALWYVKYSLRENWW